MKRPDDDPQEGRAESWLGGLGLETVLKERKEETAIVIGLLYMLCLTLFLTHRQFSEGIEVMLGIVGLLGLVGLLRWLSLI